MATIQSSTDPRFQPTMSLRDRLAGYLAGATSYLPASMQSYPDIPQMGVKQGTLAKDLMTPVENVPVVGQALAAEDLGAARQNNDWWGMGLAALGLLPGGGAEKHVAKEAVEAGRNALAEAQAGIKAFHGSPHHFEPEPDAPFGQFKDEKIGTGEGAQMYGRGHYLAESENVAKSYQEGLSGLASKISHPTLGEFSNQDILKLDEIFTNEAQRAAPTLARSRLEEIGTQVTEGIRTQSDLDHMEKFVRQSDWDPPEKAAWLAALKHAKEYSAERNHGALYEVNINADPEHFLDWDKPLSEQHDVVRQGVAAQPWGDAYTGSSVTGAQIAPTTPEGVDALKNAGIPGIRYLDAGSRGAGEGSRNYVVFDPKIINIVKKNGIAAALAAGLITESQAEEMRQQGYE